MSDLEIIRRAIATIPEMDTRSLRARMIAAGKLAGYLLVLQLRIEERDEKAPKKRVTT